MKQKTVDALVGTIKTSLPQYFSLAIASFVTTQSASQRRNCTRQSRDELRGGPHRADHRGLEEDRRTLAAFLSESVASEAQKAYASPSSRWYSRSTNT